MSKKLAVYELRANGIQFASDTLAGVDGVCAICAEYPNIDPIITEIVEHHGLKLDWVTKSVLAVYHD